MSALLWLLGFALVGCAVLAILAALSPKTAGEVHDEPGRRTNTPPRLNENGSKTYTVKRCCNGCGRELGDATDDELDAAVLGQPLPDVTQECGCANAIDREADEMGAPW